MLDVSRCPGFFCLSDASVPKVTTRALRAACEERGLAWLPLDAASVRSAQLAPLPDLAILYTPAVATRALRVEERLWSPRVATIYAGALGPLAPVVGSTAALRLAGVPVPAACVMNSTDRAALDAMVDAVGGFPAVVRFGGFSGGNGIVRVDSRAALYSLADHARSRGVTPELVAFVADATPWRVVVVDGQVAGATRGAIPDGDFRSVESEDALDYRASAPESVARDALAAARALELHAAGVDLLETPSGEVTVLEANAPFYFGHLQERGVDVAGALVDGLLRVAGRIAAE